MVAGVYVIGAYSSRFGKRPDDSVKMLTREAWRGVLADAGLADGLGIQTCWFGNCGMWTEEQGSIRGQVCLTPLVREGEFPERVPVINVEGGCATASMAFNGAWKDIVAGVADISVAFGVEKTYFAKDPNNTARLFNGGIDQYDPSEWRRYYAEAGEIAGKQFAPQSDRTVFMDTYAMQACYHMKKYGTTRQQIAFAAAKNHCNGAKNPKAQYQFEMTLEQVLADREITYPLTRSMCAPIGDGAAAAILVSERALLKMPARIRERAVKVLSTALSGGKYRSLEEPGLSRIAADKAYEQSGLRPEDMDVAEVHDATSFCEIYQAEMLRFCPEGSGGKLIEAGETSLGGRIPVNTSGGLVSKGHPVGATGLSMIWELCQQLRGEAGARQVKGAHNAICENGGGVIGFDEAACSVIILQRT